MHVVADGVLDHHDRALVVLERRLVLAEARVAIRAVDLAFAELPREFGKQGTGYNVAYLCRQLEKILKVDCVWPVVLVGAGYLGHALAAYNGFVNRGFRIVGVFDSAPGKVGTQIGESITVEPTSQLGARVRRDKVQIAIIAVPAEAAQAVADALVDAGIKSILCYAPLTLTVPKHIRVEYIDPVIHFQHMTFYLEKGCTA